MSSRENLVKWLIDIHNEVNKYTHKPVLSYEEAMEVYVDAYKEPIYNNPLFNYMVMIALVLALLILIYVFMRYL